MKDTDTFLDALVKSIRATVNFSPVEETPPAAILWPDGERDWEPLIPRLRGYLPILTLGPYNPAERSGPMAWVRCMLAHSLPDKLAPNTIPVLYLPGLSAQVEQLAELRYRSVLWLRPDDREWTVSEFFQNKDHGLGVQVRDDDYTRKAMRRVLPALGNLRLAQLKAEEPWKVKDFESLVGASITAIIEMGESAELEFKSTARCDLQQQKVNPALEYVIVKTVCGFLNSVRGGTLLIGVEDNHNICGIELEYPTFSQTKDHNPDGYERWLMTLLLNAYGQEFAASIHPSFHEVNRKTVCKIVVDPAPEPAFARMRNKDGKDEEFFYLRTGNATNALGFRAFLSYYKTRWG